MNEISSIIGQQSIETDEQDMDVEETVQQEPFSQHLLLEFFEMCANLITTLAR